MALPLPSFPMRTLSFFSGVLIAAFAMAGTLGVTPVAAQNNSLKSTASTEQVRAELMAYAPQGVPVGQTGALAGTGASVAAGQSTQEAPVWVGLQLTHAPHWHTYWKNSGDSGLPTELEWTLPPGVMAGDIAWPLPRKFPIGQLANYGYDGTVLLPVPLTITPEYKPSAFSNTLDVKLKASWLVCRQECIPQDAEFALQIPLRSSTALNGSAFEAAFKSQPQQVEGAHRIELRDGGKRLSVRVEGLPSALQGQVLEMFPETPQVLLTAATPATAGQAPTPSTWSQRWDGKVWTADFPLSPDRSESPSMMPLVLVSGGQGWRAEVPVEGPWPAVAQAATVSPALEAALKANADSQPTTAPPNTAVPAATFMLALVGALIGGLVLNLMPCVFPVLAIKVLGFAQHAQDKRAHRVSGLAYTAGVVLSFLALGALMLGLRAAGEQLGWGFQLQSPAVVAALAVLFTVIGLNLAGLFEFGSFLPSRVATMEAKHPAANSFLTGVLAVAVASPCTAPFMGASLGLAVGLPAMQALLVFGAIGLGMALPYLAASWLPAVARMLPKPGAWMIVFKQFMAFPMFGTVAWLLWVLGQQSGIDGAAALIALLVALAFLLWAVGLGGRTRWSMTALSALALVLLAGAIGPNVVKPMEEAPASASVSTGQRWQPWSHERVAQTLAAGQPVFVDFTAAWCVTCQYNKKTTLNNSDVLAAFDAAKVQTLRADWTRRDPVISAELQRLGRSGVPVYVLLAPGRDPVVLSEILSVADVKAALGRI
ncbi:thiol:disulfide interchange protein/DsbC/DsbD-like thiol-disulfide interchange protein [Ottowia thiooxydans]|uniref:Thiol:disulfide interchange protein/DsbC/DsbD-like thiol-disulfide interchange protein n=2 Tax=Ottowia thiooxydans TaxID=219182 RepID=A0ABV2QAH4_9BURK